jgi:predicted nuclease of predicted toxin-antitoxin system
MSMKLYLDDDVASPMLAQLLRKAGHNVLLPTEAGWAGSRDADHLRHAIQEDRVCLTRNYDDFQSLHDLVRAVGGHHPGILVVRRDNNPKRNLKPRDVVRAIAKLIGARVPLADQYLTLNQWR